MTDYPVLKNAPITEALLDIQVLLPADIDLAKLATIEDEVRDRYPERQEKSLLQFQFGQANGQAVVSPPTGDVQGYLFLDRFPGPTKAFQARVDGFTFSKLKPYEHWESFSEEAKELWNRYVAHIHPVAVKRLSLRSTNRFEFPMPFTDLKEFLLTGPEVSSLLAPDLSIGLSEFLTRLVIPQPSSQATAVITQVLEPIQPNSRTINVIFDIDVFALVDSDPQSNDHWAAFEELRRIRNKIFFGSITKKTQELYQ